jgi:hypothetical protein
VPRKATNLALVVRRSVPCDGVVGDAEFALVVRLVQSHVDPSGPAGSRLVKASVGPFCLLTVTYGWSGRPVFPSTYRTKLEHGTLPHKVGWEEKHGQYRLRPCGRLGSAGGGLSGRHSLRQAAACWRQRRGRVRR